MLQQILAVVFRSLLSHIKDMPDLFQGLSFSQKVEDFAFFLGEAIVGSRLPVIHRPLFFSSISVSLTHYFPLWK